MKVSNNTKKIRNNVYQIEKNECSELYMQVQTFILRIKRISELDPKRTLLT